MKKISTLILIIVAVLFSFRQKLNAAPIDEVLARSVAENFLSYLSPKSSGHQIESIMSFDQNGGRVGFLVQLSPQGYILIAGNNIRVPVKAYSFKTSFADLPLPYVDNLRNELSLPKVAATASTTIAPETTNSAFWGFLTMNTPVAQTQAYVPDTFLLTSQWNQYAPYNNFLPMIGDERTLTGCTQTAVAQVMRYHKHPANGTGVFTHNWNGQTLTAVIERPYNWDIMVDTPHTSANQWEQEEVAALMLDLGILNRADFGLDGTSAGFNYNNFRQAFGYAPIYNMTNGSSDFFSTICNEIDNLRPVLLSIPGHMTVADGYSSDLTGRNIHVNMGWGGAWDDFYYLDETIVAGGYSFPPDHRIYYNIRPCVAEECLDPLPPSGSNQPPEFVQTPADIAASGDQWIRLDARDPDGDSVGLSAYSTCSTGELSLSSNLLPLPATIEDQFCQITVFATSHDGSAATTFKTLTGPTGIYRGEQFTVGGQFANGSEVDEFTVFLSGQTTISGNRGYSNQAFYIWVKDENGITVAAPVDEPIITNFQPGYYTLSASLDSQSSSFYNYNPDYSDYLLTVAVEASLDDIAAYLGLSLSECQVSVQTSGEGSGRVISLPGSIDCGGICSESVICNSVIELAAEADEGSYFTNWSGACSGTDTKIYFRIDGGSECIANFAVTDEEASVTASAGAHGSISPSGHIPLNLGNTAQFTLSADPGYVIDGVTGTCGGNLVGNVFTTDPISADCTVFANFALTDVEARVTASAGAHGSISPSGQIPLNLGNIAQFTLSADPGYVIDGVTGSCGGSLVANVFTTNPINTDCTVMANFLLMGDINQDGLIDLRDAIIGLKILSGMPVTEKISLSADIDGDGYISFPEIMYVLNKL